MADDKKKPAAKKAAKAAEKKPAKPAVTAKPKKAAAPKAAAPKAAAEAKPVPKAAPKPPRKAPEKTVTVTQIGSPIGREAYQRATLKGLGLNKLNRSRTLEDTPAVRGMIDRVKHLVRVDAA